MRRRLARWWRRLRSPRGVVALSAAVLLPLGLLSLHLGWFATPSSWATATGWSRLPLSERSTLTALWSASDPEREPPHVSWLGHSGFVLDWKGRRLLLDPNVSEWCTLTRRVLEPAPAPAELGAVDAVLLSHAHYDHLDMPTLEGLTRLDNLVVPAGAERYFPSEDWPATRVIALEPGDCLSPDGLSPLEICAVETQHNGNRLHPFESRIDALGYVIRAGEDALFFAGDTGFDMDFAAIRQRYQPRAAILPIGAYLPRFPMKYYHLSPEEAVAAADLLGVETVMPCHFGTFTVSLDRPQWALQRFARAAHERGLRWVMPRLATAEGLR